MSTVKQRLGELEKQRRGLREARLEIWFQDGSDPGLFHNRATGAALTRAEIAARPDNDRDDKIIFVRYESAQQEAHDGTVK